MHACFTVHAEMNVRTFCTSVQGVPNMLTESYLPETIYDSGVAGAVDNHDISASHLQLYY
jgi:hypothetical protein